ncbi:hypothetical protein MSG28_012593 [Choristoneura fumiferana]|uniref:Uncharacterized protein n=1 Tax=Choristoneura fumiferana TaxID=7141 RepID=A0ACC0JH95_CHOFU|nr:hypothetical protein MSG28_012593 [Choristoneura fumiferana]
MAPTIPVARAPTLASYVIVLKDLDEKIDNILDIQFLHGYYEPTLLLLYEPIRTFAGDTCAMAGVSLNMSARVHPVIWATAGLPFDCLRAVPIQRPLGIQEGVCITLDGACVAPLGEGRLALSLKGGQLYVLTLLADSVRSVRSAHLDRAAASVLTTSMCVIEEDFLFLGSRLGNSLLLRVTERENHKEYEAQQQKEKEKESDPAAKKRRLDSLSDCIATNPQLLSEEYGRGEPAVELVACSGRGKNGALTVLQRSVRPQLITAFNLPGESLACPTARLAPTRQPVPHRPALVKATLYRDLSGLFTSADVDQVQIMLEEQSLNPGVPRRVSRWWKRHLAELKPSYWLFVVRNNGNLEIYSLPEMRLSFLVRDVCAGERVLADSLESVPQPSQTEEEELNLPQSSEVDKLKEMLVVGVGNKGTRAYKYPRGNLKLRFSRVSVAFPFGYRSATITSPDDSYEAATLRENVRQLRYFGNVGGYNGVFVCGPTPYLLVLTARGELRVHPLCPEEAPVSTFAPFNNTNCPQGLLYFNAKVTRSQN